ncbi:MAG: hypothetical protein J7L26_02775, partial [Candidatus Aminicenantes bacterium]|nr:hypothetical protein [Candidatus Aminicenantes bacterium]
MVALFLVMAILLAPWSSFSQVEKSKQGGGGKQKAKEKTSGFLALPVLFYTPETSLAIGGGGMFYYRPQGKSQKTRPSQISGLLMYTLKKQYRMSLNPD